MMMKKLMMGLALAALTTAPALAAGSMWGSYSAGYRSSAMAAPGYDAYAAAPDGFMARSMNGAPPVYENGEYQGSDPDPFIRHSLRLSAGMDSR